MGGFNGAPGVGEDENGITEGAMRHMTDEEYLRRYGHPRGVTNFLKEGRM